MMRRLHDPQDDGFTLIELVISILILGIIIAPLSSAFVLSITTGKEAQQRVSNSADAQVLTSFFTNDVASSEKVDTSATGCSGVGTPLLELPRADGSLVDYAVSESTQSEADLFVTPVYQVVRSICASSGGPVNISQTLATSLRSQPVLQCDGVACPGGSSKPLVVTLAVDEIGQPVTDASQDYVFTVTGTRRVTQ